MRLSAELITSSEQRTNPLGERELTLRGLAILAIEHLGVTRDAFDTIDFSDNRLSRLENFPRLPRLSNLNIIGNVVSTIDSSNLLKNIPNLKCLNLSHNTISSLYEVSNIGKGCTKLEFLSLVGNPVTRRQHYRLYAIRNIPSLKVLDFTKITKTERDRADRLANSAAGAALESDVRDEASSTGSTTRAKTFVPGEGRTAEESFVTNFTPEEKEKIRQLVANAKSPAEIEEIEKSVRRGILPKGATTTTTTTTTTTDSTTTTSADPSSSTEDNGQQAETEDGSDSRKRSAEEENGGENGNLAKKSRVIDKEEATNAE